jgi:ribonuclease Z
MPILLPLLSPCSIGLCLTIADGGKKRLSLHGPAGLRPFLQATARFTYRPDLAVSARDADQAETVQCKECRVHTLPLHIHSSDAATTTATATVDTRVSYICETHDRAGKFDVARAQALGVPRGPLFALLKRGEDVTLGDGRVVPAAEIVAAAAPGRSAAVVCAVPLGSAPALTELPSWAR